MLGATVSQVHNGSRRTTRLACPWRSIDQIMFTAIRAGSHSNALPTIQLQKKSKCKCLALIFSMDTFCNFEVRSKSFSESHSWESFAYLTITQLLVILTVSLFSFLCIVSTLLPIKSREVIGSVEDYWKKHSQPSKLIVVSSQKRQRLGSTFTTFVSFHQIIWRVFPRRHSKFCAHIYRMRTCLWWQRTKILTTTATTRLGEDFQWSPGIGHRQHCSAICIY